MSDVGQRYFCPPGYVVRDRFVDCEFKRKDGTVVWRKVRVIELSSEPVEQRDSA
jgi:hypothetical protein